MKKVLVQSKYDTSRQYARWLAERIACDLAETKNFDPQNFDRYAKSVLGASVDFLKKHRTRLKER